MGCDRSCQTIKTGGFFNFAIRKRSKSSKAFIKPPTTKVISDI